MTTLTTEAISTNVDLTDEAALAPTSADDVIVAKIAHLAAGLRDEGKFSLLSFLQAAEHKLGGTLVLQAPCRSNKRSHPEAAYQAERFAGIQPA